MWDLEIFYGKKIDWVTKEEVKRWVEGTANWYELDTISIITGLLNETLTYGSYEENNEICTLDDLRDDIQGEWLEDHLRYEKKMTDDEIKKYLKEKEKTCTHSPVYMQISTRLLRGSENHWIVTCKLCGKKLNEEGISDSSKD